MKTNVKPADRYEVSQWRLQMVERSELSVYEVAKIRYRQKKGIK